ncbi:unnamed protein product [Auanema sp. JU1783]|nr:unnamed protein product [Auanema sp. JU1783]
MQLILNAWRNRTGGAVDASAFLQTLESPNAMHKEKELIIEVFDDWDVLTNTWFEVADSLSFIEGLYEDTTFPARDKAALLSSKVAFCLEDYQLALTLALSAGTAFQLTPRPSSTLVGNKDEEYVNKIIEVALDTYKLSRNEGTEIDNRLEALVNRLFERNLEKKEFRYVVGLALETRRVDMVERAIKSSNDVSGLLTETVQKVLDGQLDANLRNSLLDMLLTIFSTQDQPDFVALVQCLIRLEKPADVADLLNRLLNQNEGELLAYQIAFDLYENASQQFIAKILTVLNSEEASRSDDTETVAESSKKVTPHSRLRSILRGEETIKHHMQFLIKNNHTDMLILKEMRDYVRTATAHNATVVSNGIMHLGTTCDDFLRDNLDWISKATNWNKFNAVASLGLIHKGHETAAMKLLEPYLPKSETDQYGFKEGGSLYALGLMHANHGNPSVIKFLKQEVANASTAAVRHGACLGLGLAAMGTHDQEVYFTLRDALYLDEAVTGEAAGLAMGLVMVGSLNEAAFNEMVQYVSDTQHDKIQRGLRTGIAILGYGRQEECEKFVTPLLENKSNAVLRATGVCMLAMAYAGTGKAAVTTRLLEKVATDPNNDVKRFAVMAFGFLLIKYVFYIIIWFRMSLRERLVKV